MQTCESADFSIDRKVQTLAESQQIKWVFSFKNIFN